MSICGRRLALLLLHFIQQWLGCLRRWFLILATNDLHSPSDTSGTARNQKNEHETDDATATATTGHQKDHKNNEEKDQNWGRFRETPSKTSFCDAPFRALIAIGDGGDVGPARVWSDHLVVKFILTERIEPLEFRMAHNWHRA